MADDNILESLEKNDFKKQTRTDIGTGKSAEVLDKSGKAREGTISPDGAFKAKNLAGRVKRQGEHAADSSDIVSDDVQDDTASDVTDKLDEAGRQAEDRVSKQLKKRVQERKKERDNGSIRTEDDAGYRTEGRKSIYEESDLPSNQKAKNRYRTEDQAPADAERYTESHAQSSTQGSHFTNSGAASQNVSQGSTAMAQNTASAASGSGFKAAAGVGAAAKIVEDGSAAAGGAAAAGSAGGAAAGGTAAAGGAAAGGTAAGGAVAAPVVGIIILIVIAVILVIIILAAILGAFGGNSGADYVQYAIDVAEDDTHGYAQGVAGHQPWGSRLFDPDVDCSSLVYYSLINTGYGTTDEYGTYPFTTYTMKSLLTEETGFEYHTFTSEDELEYGDIMWCSFHTEIYAGDGQIVGARGDEDGKPGDSGGNEVRVRSFYSSFSGGSRWEGYFRPLRSLDSNANVTATTAFLSCLSYYNKVLTNDSAAWVYSNTLSPQTGSFDDMLASGKKFSNCALLVRWALYDMGVLEEGQTFYGTDFGTIVGQSNVEDEMDIIKAGGKTLKQLMANNTLKAGDILIWASGQHTYVYAGNGMIYTAGRNGDTYQKNGNHYFNAFYMKANSSHLNGKISYIVRFKSSFVPDTYRDSSGTVVSNYNEELADDVTEEDFENLVLAVWYEDAKCGIDYEGCYLVASACVNRYRNSYNGSYSSLTAAIKAAGLSHSAGSDYNSAAAADTALYERAYDAALAAIEDPYDGVYYANGWPESTVKSHCGNDVGELITYKDPTDTSAMRQYYYKAKSMS